MYAPQTAPIDHGGSLPDPGQTRIIFYLQKSDDPVREALREMVRSVYRTGPNSADLNLISA